MKLDSFKREQAHNRELDNVEVVTPQQGNFGNTNAEFAVDKDNDNTNIAPEENFEMALDAKHETPEKEKKEHKYLKKGLGLGSMLVKMTLLGILVGSPMLGVLGVLAIKYNKPIMDLCGIINYKPMLIPKVENKEK